MAKKKISADVYDKFESAAAKAKDPRYVLRLYVSGASPKSIRAIATVKKVCEEYLANHYELEVIDIYQKPTLAIGEQIVAVPTLIKRLPPPLQRLIGDMTNIQQVLLGIDLISKQ
jgi:circadian clock protein KaiB